MEVRHIDDLKERLENLSKELELVKQSQAQEITYKNDNTKDTKKKDLEEIVADVDKRDNKKGNKKKAGNCNCGIY